MMGFGGVGMGKRILAALLCVFMAAVLLPKTARAAGETEMDVSKGNITIGPTAVIGMDSNGDPVNSNLNSNGYIITNSDPNVSTTHTISVSATTQLVKITLDGVNIDAPSDGQSALDMMVGTHVTLTLADGSMNKLSSSSLCAGIHVPMSATLIIRGSGTLEATAEKRGAGIGGNGANNDRNCGSVIINSGTVKATGGSFGAHGGAGIGGAGSGTNDGTAGSGGTITINGGVVTAVGRGNGAGIGGGGGESGSTGGSGGTITINGGVVTAAGSNLSAGIGGGGAGSVGVSASGVGGEGGSIKINGGTVSARNGYSSSYAASQYGAAIGGGALSTGPTTSTRTDGSVDLSGYARYEWKHDDAITLPAAFQKMPYPDNLQNAPGWTIIRPMPDVPKTGDDTPTALLAGLALLSGAILLLRRRRAH